ncbi:MAG: DUF4115 domain-containing protein [Candidatus Omnitrophica bacterium]|nr:DUF4115 domain-containing protein [Candidatus Omnitrophota bacterium]
MSEKKPEQNQVQQPETIGQRLHRARLRKKVTIDQAYKDIKVHPKILSALEEDRYEEILSPTYVKAFLKSYCRYLDLDSNKILEDFSNIVQKDAPKPTLTVKTSAPKSGGRVFADPDWGKYINTGKRVVLPVLSGIAVFFLSVFIIISAARTVKKMAAQKAAAGPKAVVSQRAPEKTKAKETPSAIIKELSIPKDQPLTLIVKTKDSVWLQVRSDGKIMFQNVLKKGSVEAYKAQDTFQIWTGKAEFLDLVLNGNPLGSPGNGVIRKISLTHQGLKVEKK